MNETDDSGGRSRGAGKTLSLKRTETSTVRQSFSHGRSKAVVVEKKRARATPTARGTGEAEKPAAKRATEDTAQPATDVREESRRAAVGRGGVVLRELTEDEKEARMRALTDAKFAEEEARKRAEEDATRRAAEEERMRGGLWRGSDERKAANECDIAWRWFRHKFRGKIVGAGLVPARFCLIRNTGRDKSCPYILNYQTSCVTKSS